MGVAIAAVEEFGAGSVVGGKEDEGVLDGAHGLELIEDATDFPIHPFDHGGVDFHLGGLEFLLGGRQRIPGDGAGDFVGIHFGDELGVRQVPVGNHGGFGRGVVGRDDAEFACADPAPFADEIPTDVVAGALAGDVPGGCLEREVRGGEGEVSEERLAGVLGLMLAQVGDESGCVLGGRVVIRPGGNGRERAIVFRVVFRAKIPVVVMDHIGVIESGVGDDLGCTHDVPFAGVIGAVTGLAQVLGEELGPCGETSDGWVHADLLGVVAGHERGAGGPAASGVVEAGETKAVRSEAVEVGRGDFAAVTAEIGEAEIIGEDDEDVGTRR